MKRLYFSNDRELEGLKWVAKVVDFGLGLSDSAAVNEMYSALYFLRQRKNLYRHETKQQCNLALKCAERHMTEIKGMMKNRSFWEDYSDKVIDDAHNDMMMFRIAIKSELDRLDIPDSEMLSYVECARVMLDMCVKQFDHVMENGKEKFGRDFSADFREYRLYDVYCHWDRMCGRVTNGVVADLNTPHIQMAFDAMCKKFAEGGYIESCLTEAAKNNPDFINHVHVIENK